MDNNTFEDRIEKIENDVESNKKKNNFIIILLIIIIIILLLLGWLCFKIGKIGSSPTVPAFNEQEECSCKKCTSCENKECETCEDKECAACKERETCKECKETECNCKDWETKNILRVSSEGAKWDEDANLNIFNNAKFNGEKIIAPRSKGTYNFYVTNEIGEHITYDIKLTDEASHFVNMKYKLKLDNIYIRGSKDKYVSIDELHLEDIIVTKDSSSYYTLEWYWEDDDKNDTKTGQADYVEYTLTITVSAVKGATINTDPA